MKYQLDITQEHCPMTFVKTKLQLAKMQVGDVVDILLTEGEPLENVPKSAKEQGHEVVSVSHYEGNVHRVTIRKC
jgi:TusA-related sulfurtransferase